VTLILPYDGLVVELEDAPQIGIVGQHDRILSVGKAGKKVLDKEGSSGYNPS